MLHRLQFTWTGQICISAGNISFISYPVIILVSWHTKLHRLFNHRTSCITAGFLSTAFLPWKYNSLVLGPLNGNRVFSVAALRTPADIRLVTVRTWSLGMLQVVMSALQLLGRSRLFSLNNWHWTLKLCQFGWVQVSSVKIFCSRCRTRWYSHNGVGHSCHHHFS